MRPLTLSSKNPFHQKEQSLIFRCKDEQGQSLLLKILNISLPSSAAIRQFYEEYELTQPLKTPNIRRVLEKGVWEGKPALLLEYIEGQTIKQAFVKQKQPLQFLLKIAIQLAATLDKIHQEKIIHKDISSENILVHVATQKATIIDFGIATRLNLKAIYLGNPIHVQGNLSYISPEQTGRMNRTLDYRSDLYSLGITLYEMLTGRLPFDKEDPLELVHCHLAIPARPPHEWVSNRKEEMPWLIILSEIIVKLLSKNAENRYQSAFGLKADLKNCLAAFEEGIHLSNFQLGQNDFSHKFHIPQKLYGRAKELAILTNTYKNISEGSTQLLLISGYSGVGKSALVYEIHKPITENRGYFIEGKFDQFQRNIPYYAWIQAFENFVNLLLTENQSKLEEWKRQFLAVLNGQGKVLTTFLPSLEKIIGSQPNIPELSPAENQNRFNRVFTNFVKTIARPQHPLFIFIDDWQWTDTSSLRLLEKLMTDVGNKYLLITGAYRDNEVSHEHLFQQTLDKLTSLARPILAIKLSNLLQTDINQLIGDTLKCPLEYCQPLSKLIYTKTNGNAFFLRQMLQSLYEKGALKLKFDARIGMRWDWNMTEIEGLKITDNVVELMVEKAQQLPSNTRKVLELAACIGTLFQLPILSVIYQKSEKKTYEDLLIALEEGLIIPAGVQFTFAHDRIQQATYSLIPEKDKEQFHFQIGKLLLENQAKKQTSQELENVFDIVNQLNFGQHLIKIEKEKKVLANLNLKVGIQAKKAIAYESALHYLRIGKSLLSNKSWDTDYQLTLGLHRHLAECETLCHNFMEAEMLFQTAFDNAQNLKEKIEIADFQIWMAIWIGKREKGIEIAIKGLHLCELPFPKEGQEMVIAIEAKEKEIEQITQQNRVAHFSELQEMEDATKILASKLLSRLTILSYIHFGQETNFKYIILTGVLHSLTFGKNENTSIILAFYCSILAGQEKFEECYHLATIALEMAETYPHFHARPQFLNRIGLWSLLYGKHLKESLKLFEEGYQFGMEIGNLPDAITCRYDRLMHFLHQGNPLKEVVNLAENILEFNEEVGYQNLSYLIKLELCLSQLLISGNPKFEINELIIEEAKTAPPSPMVNTAWLGLNIMQQFFWSGKFKEAIKTKSIFAASIDNATSNIKWADHDFFCSLSIIAVYGEFSTIEKENYATELADCRRRMKLKAEACPDNFLHKHLLIEAEIARLESDNWQTGKIYEKAISVAQQYHFTHIEALGNELAAKFWHQLTQYDFAHNYFQKAYQCYQRWEAYAINQRLVKDFPTYFPNQVNEKRKNSSSSSDVVFDLESLLKASHILSGEIVLSNLISKMLTVVIENAGAEKGILIAKEQEQLLIKAQGNANGKVELLPPKPLETSKNVPIILLNYVARTLKPLVLENAAQSDLFVNDFYIQTIKPKSVLCFPIFRKEQLSHLFYLENNLATSVFTQNRLKILQSLSAQIGISIENALLYEGLEQSLRKQIHLTQKQAQVTEAYSKFVPHTFLKVLGHHSILDVQLGDQVQEKISILFSDIRAYTTLSESMTPAENFNFLNAYLKRVVPAIINNDGFVNQYAGDGIMALFLRQPEDALKAAIQLQLYLRKYNEERVKKGRAPITIGVGIHTGSLILGILGDKSHMQATVVSDTVNIASRLEGLTKYFHASIIISGEILSTISNPNTYQYRFLGKVQVKGKTDVHAIYEVFDSNPISLKMLKQKANPDFQQGLEQYFARNFIGAVNYFKQALNIHPKDLVIQRYFQNAAKYMVENAPDEWTGAEVMISK